MNIPEEAVEALAVVLAKEELARAGVEEGYGWDADSDSAEMFLARIRARKYMRAAAPHLMAQVAADILEGMQAWAGEEELGFLEGFTDAAQEEARRSAGSGE